ncbi:MAG: class I SAM-dependent methyltransferase [Chloroflexota bacterium]
MDSNQINGKPAHWAAERAAAFQDQSVVDHYHLRPPYPPAVIETLAELATVSPRTVLDVGTGTGELARRLVGQVERVDALDRSEQMIARGRTLPGGNHPRLRWMLGAAETAPLDPPYALIMGGSSLHWLEWDTAFPRFESLLSPDGVIAIVRRGVAPTPWQDELRELLRRYEPGRQQRRPDLVAELERRRLFREQGRREADPVPVEQSIEDYVGSFHSRSAFSPARMSSADATALDQQVRDLVRPWSREGMLRLRTTGSVVWGRVY